MDRENSQVLCLFGQILKKLGTKKLVIIVIICAGSLININYLLIKYRWHAHIDIYLMFITKNGKNNINLSMV
jgi:hypothetical protein